MTIEFTINGLPKMTNAMASHWRARNAEARKWKDLVAQVVVFHKIKPAKPFTKARLTLTRHSASEPDTDGLISGFKHVIDGLRAIGVIIDDKPSNIGVPEYRWQPAKIRQGFITIKVEGLE
jgi:hypothetical protein